MTLAFFCLSAALGLIVGLMMLTGTRRYTGQGVMPWFGRERAFSQAVGLEPGISYLAGQQIGFVPNSNAGVAVNDVQTITVANSTGGTFDIYIPWVGVNTLVAGNAYNISAANLQAALVAILGTGNVTVGLAAGVYTITFVGALAGRPLPLLYVYDKTTGAGHAVTIAHTTLGQYAAGAYAKYDSARTDGAQTSKGILEYDTAVDVYQGVTLGQSAGPDFGVNIQGGAPAWFEGEFRASDIVGLDATSLAQLGKVVLGDPTAYTSPSTIVRIGV